MPGCRSAFATSAKVSSSVSKTLPMRKRSTKCDCESDFDLLGLFRGRGLVQRGATAQTGEFPNMIWLYRRPILDFWATGEDSLEAIVTHVLIHEIGHHFGFSDADMAAIEKGADS